jgi:hypothetical protein
MAAATGGVCRNRKTGANVGEYELKVESADANVTVHGFHAINGKRQSTWVNSDLFNSSKKFTVQQTERHQTLVVATFLPAANANTKVTVTILHGGNSVMTPCVLQPNGRTESLMSVITPPPTP